MAETKTDSARTDSTDEGVGDVESAGETTAAAALPTGDANAKPVGEGTRVKVAGDGEGGGGG
jgi:hypothetical protein